MWILGSLLLLLASMIAGNIQPGLGVTEPGLALGLLVAFVLFLVAGVLWISIAVAVKKSHEV